MADRSTERPASISSSHTETEALDDHEKNGTASSSDGSYVKLKTPDEMDIGDDIERAELLPPDQEKPEPQPIPPDNSTRTAAIWMIVNTLATIGIVGGYFCLWHCPN